MKKHLPKILIVDDDQLYLTQFKTILSKEIQANYFLSDNARNAIELINKNSFAIILLDVDMPEKSGFELAKVVRNSKLNIYTPIIFITGIRIDDQSIFEGYKAGAVDYLSKPVNKFILFSKIKTFLELDLQKNKLQYTRKKLKEINESLEKQVDQRTLQLKKELNRNIKANDELQLTANQLKENHHFLETLVETIPIPVYYKNDKGEFIGCNKAFEEYLSTKKKDFLGKTIYDMVSKEFGDEVTKVDAAIVKSGEKQITEIKIPGTDGSVRNLITYKNHFHFPHSNRSGIIGTIIDISELTRAQGLLNIQHTIDYLSSMEKGRKDIFKNIINGILEFEWVDGAGIYIMDEEKQDLTLVSHKGLSGKFINRAKYFPENSAQAKLVLNNKPIYGSYDKLAEISGKEAGEEYLKGFAVIPLFHNQKVVGAFNVVSRSKKEFSETDKTGIESFTSKTGNLIVYAQKQEKLKAYQKELEQKIKARTKVLREANIKLNEEIEFHKKTKIALAESEYKYRSVFENAQDGIVLYNAETLELVEMNRKAHEDLGYTFEEFKNLKYGEFVIYKDANERKELIEQLLLKGKITFQAKHRKKNGEICHRIVSASILIINDKKYIQGIIHDISEIMEKEMALQKSRKKYRELQANIPIGVFMTTLDGKFSYINKTGVNMLGYDSVEELLKIPVSEIYYDKNKRTEIIEELQRTGYINNLELQFIRKDKSLVWCLVSVSAIKGADGNPMRFDGIVEDISEKKKVQLKLDEAYRKIQLSNKNLKKKIKKALNEQQQQQQYIIQKSKLESLGELAAGIAHEINQPLGILTLSFENLLSKFDSGNITIDYLQKKTESIIGNIDRIRDIITHIRIFSREHDSIVMEKVDINQVIQDVHQLIKTQYQNHNIIIVHELCNNLGFTIGSKLKIEQVFFNLLSNAKYALDDNESKQDNEEYTKTITITTRIKNNRINILVKDNGTGIDQKSINKIFDPFFTTKPEWVGTGLGLSIVYGIIKEMQGEIKVDSKPNKYTRFNILLPRFPEND